MVVLTLAELVVGLFTGRLGEAWALAAGARRPHPPYARPPRPAGHGLQEIARSPTTRSSLSRTAGGAPAGVVYLPARDTETYVGVERNVAQVAAPITPAGDHLVVVIVGILVASRTMFDTKVPTISESFPLPESPRGLWSDSAAAWSPAGLGGTVANPDRMGSGGRGQPPVVRQVRLGLTVIVVGLVLLGVTGAWRLVTVFPTNRPRIAALAVYAAVPLTPGVISTGRLTALVAYAEWSRGSSICFGQRLGSAPLIRPRRATISSTGCSSSRPRAARRTAVLAVVTAIAVGMAPSVLPVVALVAVLLAAATLVAASWRIAGWLGGLGLAASRGRVPAQPAVGR